MFRYHSISSCLVLALLGWLCVSSCHGAEFDTNSAEKYLRGQPLSSARSLDDEYVWDYDFGIGQSAEGAIELDRFWVKVFVTIGKTKIAAALSKYGLFLHPGFAYKIPQSGTLTLGSNKLGYNLEVPPLTPKCPAEIQTPLKLEVYVSYFFGYLPDTWFKSSYKCASNVQLATKSLCHPTMEENDYSIKCERPNGSITNLTDNTLIPIWNERYCSFVVPCSINNNLLQLIDANKIKQCYQGIFDLNTECPLTPAPTPVPTQVPTPTPAPTKPPTYHVPDCGVPNDAVQFPEYTETVKALGYAVTRNIPGNGVQYHLVPSDPSSCMTAYVNIFERNEIFNFPDGCDGYLFATLFKNQRCEDVVRMKFKYSKENGSKILHMTDNGEPFVF